MAGLATGLVQPTLAIGGADRTHVAVAALALHHHGAIGIDCAAHGAAEAPGGGSRMAVVAGGAVVFVVERQTRDRIDDVSVEAVLRLSERRHAGQAGVAVGSHGVGQVAAIAKHGFAGVCGSFQPVGIASLNEGLGVEGRVLRQFVVEAEDVELVVLIGIGVVDPASGRLGGGLGT